MIAKKPVRWREYQEQVAQYFRDLGMNAEVEAKVKGVRAEHEIDVWVAFQINEIEQRWVIECKHYNGTRVSKDKFLTLLSIMDDVGGHVGMILSETGFQSGARNAAHKTNIELTSLEELYRKGLPMVIQQWTAEVMPRLGDLRRKVMRAMRDRRDDPLQEMTMNHLRTMLVRLTTMDEGLNAARDGEPAVVIDIKARQVFTGDPGKPFTDPVLTEVQVFGVLGALVWIRERIGVFEERFKGIIRGDKVFSDGTYFPLSGPPERGPALISKKILARPDFPEWSKDLPISSRSKPD